LGVATAAAAALYLFRDSGAREGDVGCPGSGKLGKIRGDVRTSRRGVTASRGEVTPRGLRFGGLRSATSGVTRRETRFVAESAGVREYVGVLVGCFDWQKPSGGRWRERLWVRAYDARV
jgi:hypothetical protein